MSEIDARVILLNERPQGIPNEKTFRYETIKVPSSAPPGKVLLKLTYLSVDPYLRNSIRSLPLNEPMAGWNLAEVVDSKNPNFKKGQHVFGVFKWQTYQVHDGVNNDTQEIRAIPSELQKKVPLSAWLGVLGMPGRTGYFGLLDEEIGRMKPGQTVLVSAAAGAVGSFVGQLAKLKGAKRVIGTAGGPQKCKLVKEKYGFDECLDYKELDTTEKMQEALKKAAPEGLNVYFDNTGGHVTYAALRCLNKFGRVALCGNISSYNSENPQEDKIPNILSLSTIYGSHKICGYIQRDFADKFDQFYTEVPPLVAEGKIKYDETLNKGFDTVAEGFASLFKGTNTGKVVIKVE